MPQKSYFLHWDNTDPATPALIEPLLDDKGLGEGGPDELQAREATKNYLIGLIREGETTNMGDLSCTASYFYEGYLRGLWSQTGRADPVKGKGNSDNP